MILKLRRQGTDELIRLPQLLREVERKIPEHCDLDLRVVDGVAHATGERGKALPPAVCSRHGCRGHP